MPHQRHELKASKASKQQFLSPPETRSPLQPRYSCNNLQQENKQTWEQHLDGRVLPINNLPTIFIYDNIICKDRQNHWSA